MPSSVIERMQYEPQGRSLLIVFRGGRGVYRYFDVSEREWEDFTRARSKGTYLNREFKARDHLYVKVREAAAARGPESGSALSKYTWPRGERDGAVDDASTLASKSDVD